MAVPNLRKSRKPQPAKKAPVQSVAQDMSEDVRRRIVAAAAEAFMKYGYAATSINHISGLLDATKGMIYHHYDSKAELFFAVHMAAMDMNLGVIRPPAKLPLPASQRLRKMLEDQTILIMDQFPFMCVARQGVEMYLLDSTDELQRAMLLKLIARRKEHELLFQGVVEDGIRSGEFRKVDPGLANKSLLGVLNWLTVWYQPRLNKTAEGRAKIVSGISDFVLGSLMQHGASSFSRQSGASIT